MPYLSRITLEEGQENFAIEYNGTILLDKAKTKILWANNITSSI
jgi:hypothetical protein